MWNEAGCGYNGSTRSQCSAGPTRRTLEASCDEKRKELVLQLSSFNLDAQTDVSELIEHLLFGNVDFATEAQAVIDGIPMKGVQVTGYFILLLIEYDRRADKVKND